VKTYEGLCV